jgi:hypothetical protein
MKALKDHHHFSEVQMPAFANVVIKEKAPSHEEKPFLAQAVSEPLIHFEDDQRSRNRLSFFRSNANAFQKWILDLGQNKYFLDFGGILQLPETDMNK